MRGSSAPPVVAVGQDDFNRVFAFDGDLATALEADNVLLKANPAFGSHPLFFGLDWCPVSPSP